MRSSYIYINKRILHLTLCNTKKIKLHNNYSPFHANQSYLNIGAKYVYFYNHSSVRGYQKRLIYMRCVTRTYLIFCYSSSIVSYRQLMLLATTAFTSLDKILTKQLDMPDRYKTSITDVIAHTYFIQFSLFKKISLDLWLNNIIPLTTFHVTLWSMVPSLSLQQQV